MKSRSSCQESSNFHREQYFIFQYESSRSSNIVPYRVAFFFLGGGAEEQTENKGGGEKKEEGGGKPALTLHGQPESMLREIMAEKTRNSVV